MTRALQDRIVLCGLQCDAAMVALRRAESRDDAIAADHWASRAAFWSARAFQLVQS